MDLIEQCQILLNNINDFKLLNKNDLTDLLSKKTILTDKDYDIDLSFIENLIEEKNNDIKIFKNQIKSVKKILKLNENNQFLNNKKYINKCRYILKKISKFHELRSNFKNKLKSLEKKYESEYEIDLFKNNKNNSKKYRSISKNIKQLSQKFINKFHEQKILSLEIIHNEEEDSNSSEEEKNKEDEIKNTKKLINSNIIVKNNKNQNSLNINNLNKKNYINNKNNIIYSQNIIDWKLSLLILKYPLHNTYYNRCEIRFYDEDFKYLNNSFSVSCDDNSNKKELIFNYKFNYTIKNKKFYQNIYVLFVFSSFYKIKESLHSSPITWGFSLFQINKGNDLEYIKNGYFELPIYNPYHLKLEKKIFLELFHNKKFDLVNISSLLISNLPKTSISNYLYDSGKFNNISFSPTIFDIIMMKKINKLDFEKYEKFKIQLEKSHKFIDFNNNLNKNKLKNIDFHLFDHSISQNIEILNNNKINKPEMDIRVKALINPHKEFGYMIKASHYILDDNANIVRTDKKYIKKFIFDSFDKYIIFHDKYFNIKNVKSEKDIILFKIYYQEYADDGTYTKSTYGYSIIPLFIYQNTNLNGEFLIPIIINKIDYISLSKIFKNSLYVFLNDVANGKLSQRLNFRKADLLVNIKNSRVIDENYKNLNFFRINNMFMPKNLFNLYSNVKYILQKKLKKINK